MVSSQDQGLEFTLAPLHVVMFPYKNLRKPNTALLIFSLGSYWIAHVYFSKDSFEKVQDSFLFLEIWDGIT